MTEKKNIALIKLDRSPEKMNADLEKYCQLAIELGATDAKAIKTNQIPIDERVVLKCRIPKCFSYNTCANCPPYSLKPEETQKYLTLYEWAIVYRKEIAPEVIVRDKGTIEERVEAYKNVFEICNKLESTAFYDGYYLSTGFGAGSCKSTLCWQKNMECLVLQNKKCRYSLRARPSMEAVGIDCYKLAVELGWQIIPIGSDAKAENVHHGSLIGLILID